LVNGQSPIVQIDRAAAGAYTKGMAEALLGAETGAGWQGVQGVDLEPVFAEWRPGSSVFGCRYYSHNTISIAIL